MKPCKWCGARVHINSVKRHEDTQCRLRNIVPKSDGKKKLEGTAAILADRCKTHGLFCSHAAIAQDLKAVMHKTPNWGSLPQDAQESLEMIVHKIARILNGDPLHADHWVDIAGYSTLIAQQL
jgi:hypothetical protein